MGMMVIDPTEPQGDRIFPTTIMEPVSDSMIVTTGEEPFTDALGNTTTLEKPLFFLPTRQGGKLQLRHVPIDGSDLDLQMMQQFPGQFDVLMQEMESNGLEGAEQVNAALEQLRIHVQQQRQ